MIAGYKVTIYGTDVNNNNALVTKSTLDNLADKVVTTFDVLGLYMRQSDDIETARNLNGRQVVISKINYEQYTIELVYQNFIKQTNPATYTANRFNYDLLKKKYHYLFFHNTDENYDYPYLSNFYNSDPTKIDTHALQVVFLSKGAVESTGGLNKWNLEFETAYPLI